MVRTNIGQTSRQGKMRNVLTDAALRLTGGGALIAGVAGGPLANEATAVPFISSVVRDYDEFGGWNYSDLVFDHRSPSEAVSFDGAQLTDRNLSMQIGDAVSFFFNLGAQPGFGLPAVSARVALAIANVQPGTLAWEIETTPGNVFSLGTVPATPFGGAAVSDFVPLEALDAFASTASPVLRLTALSPIDFVAIDAASAGVTLTAPFIRSVVRDYDDFGGWNHSNPFFDHRSPSEVVSFDGAQLTDRNLSMQIGDSVSFFFNLGAQPGFGLAAVSARVALAIANVQPGTLAWEIETTPGNVFSLGTVPATPFDGAAVSDFVPLAALDAFASTASPVLRLTALTPINFVAIDAASAGVTLVPGFPDYNFDETVDAADYVVWRKFDTTQAGYSTWRRHFGELGDLGADANANAAIPEPATLGLSLIGAAAVAGGALGRRRPATHAIDEN